MDTMLRALLAALSCTVYAVQTAPAGKEATDQHYGSTKVNVRSRTVYGTRHTVQHYNMATHKLSAATISTISGKYKVVKEENFDSFTKKMGVNVVLRKISKAATIHLELSYNKEKDIWVIKHTVGPKTLTTEFKFGHHFDETTMDGRKVKSLINPSPDNNKKWIYEQVCETNSEHSADLIWIFNGDGVETTYKSGDVVAKHSLQREK